MVCFSLPALSAEFKVEKAIYLFLMPISVVEKANAGE
jgi:hypothetical protein